MLMFCRQEYSAWAGMIVTQYGQISRGQDRPARSYSGSGGAGAETPQQSAIAQLRAHYGLSPASSPTAGAHAWGCVSIPLAPRNRTKNTNSCHWSLPYVGVELCHWISK